MTDTAPTETPPLTRQEIGKILHVSLRAARVLMECGDKASVVARSAETVARSFGVDVLGFRIGYASLAMSLGDQGNVITRMIDVGRHGVNHRLAQSVRRMIRNLDCAPISCDAFDAELDRLVASSPRYPAWFVCVAVGAACAAFGRLLGIDWPAFAPVWAASTLAQYARHTMLHKQMNACVVAAIVALMAATMTGVGAKLAGSATINLAMIASILLLVPGVPSMNAQADIMDGHPTMGSARMVSVLMIMIFATVGIWMAQTILGVR